MGKGEKVKKSIHTNGLENMLKRIWKKNNLLKEIELDKEPPSSWEYIPGTFSSLNVTWILWSAVTSGTKDTSKTALPSGSTWVGIDWPSTRPASTGFTKISRLPSPARLASTSGQGGWIKQISMLLEKETVIFPKCVTIIYIVIWSDYNSKLNILRGNQFKRQVRIITFVNWILQVLNRYIFTMEAKWHQLSNKQASFMAVQIMGG